MIKFIMIVSIKSILFTVVEDMSLVIEWFVTIIIVEQEEVTAIIIAKQFVLLRHIALLLIK